MKKKELLSMRKMLVTPKMYEMVASDTGKWVSTWYGGGYTEYETDRFYRATVENEILKVAIFARKSIAEERKEPDFEVFISKTDLEWTSYEPSTGKWYTGKIDNLKYNENNALREVGKQGYETGLTRKTVNEYFDTHQNKSTKAAVLEFQNEVKKEELKRRHRSELEQIDEVMNEVPPLPQDFEQWIINSAYVNERYFMYQRKGKMVNGYCTHCNTWSDMDKIPYHNLTGKCPNCGSKVITKAYNKQKTVSDRKQVGIIQRLTDNTGFIYRVLEVFIKYDKEKKYKREIIYCSEQVRYRLDDNFAKRESFEYREYKNTGVTRWCHEQSGYGYYYGYSMKSILYTRNLTKLLNNTELKYIPVQKLLKVKEGIAIDVINMLTCLHERKEYEMLIKMKLIRLTWDLINSGDREVKVHRKETSPWKYLNISKENAKMAIEMNISLQGLRVIQVAEEVETRVNEEQIRFFEKFSCQQYKRILRLGHLEKFMRYFKENLEVEKNSGRTFNDYIDYLKDCEVLGYVMTKQQLFPKNFQNVHHEVAVLRQEKEDNLKKADLRKKNRILKKMLPELKKLYEEEDDKFKLILPTCKGDLVKEGQQQHNCVGGSYFDSMISGKCVIAFLRKKEDLNKSFCTVEFSSSGLVMQNRTYCNAQAPDEAIEFINKVSERVIKELKKREDEKIKQERIQIAI